ncbi:hypothetical protein SPRG_20496 [Saprolegnia parasitica CBS 223.65]|uniref:Uncharacterized protein n=1 Tax=Saprolegnia parasitica (strain CBS 223.65) TaxID=695850 RepID=A0A067C8A2_SAPPC|nr:hypothetical protein SPRG_20496 [Saprolegnia parasitica CBS 223.65]KDO26698.1 hypothetical protein SPRG_20496 [Saprolegnia parasitica CBS 223.65]|eukprot:XP_012202586.1 hypothetical protein SPRG_20496 [Saprolegnia parasitica CBS 223.65]
MLELLLSTTTTTMSPTYQKCGYRTGKCTHPSALKRNGQFHRLCAFHRQKANWNQMKLDRKKRERRASTDDDDAVAVFSPAAMSPMLPSALDDGPLTLASDEMDFFFDAILSSKTLPDTTFY